MGIVIGVIVVLAVAAFLAFLTIKSKSADLFKWVGIMLFIAFCFTWVIPYGYFSEGTFYEYGMNRLGLTDVPTILYYAIYFALTSVVYLFVLGGFYGILSKSKSYQALVKKLGKKIKGKEVLTTILTIVFLVVLTSLLKSTLAVVVFVPFIISVLLNAKYDKLTAFALSFGSVLVGTLAATYGTEGLGFFNSYVATDVNVGLLYRVIIAGIALILFILLNVRRTIKVVKKNRVHELDDDLYAVEEVKGKVKTWPAIVILAILLVFVVLGFVGWSDTFNITIFESFHKWLTGLTIGEDFTIMASILGTSAVAFGTFEITTLIPVLLVLSIIVALMDGMKVSDYMNNFAKGLTKMFKPVCFYSLGYAVFVVAYMSPFIPTISDWAFGLTKKFNPFITTIAAFVSSIFHADLGYTGYIVGSVLTTTYESSLALAHTLYVSMYGLVQVLMPTSCMLLAGLAYLKIDYKAWFKYIWIFALAMFIVILILAAVVHYI